MRVPMSADPTRQRDINRGGATTARHTAKLAGGGSSGEIKDTGVTSVQRGFDWCY